MKNRKILLVAGVIISVIVAFQLLKQKNTKKRLAVVADEGYETAEDILFPKRRTLKLG